MKFENLPNELLFQIFQYLYLHESVHAFEQLNNRFRLLLLSHSQYCLNHSLSALKIDNQIMDHLSPYIQSVKSLKLMSYTFRVLDSERFLTKYSLNLFYTQLQSLTFDYFISVHLTDVVPLLPDFKQLKFVSIIQSDFMENLILRQIQN